MASMLQKKNNVPQLDSYTCEILDNLQHVYVDFGLLSDKAIDLCDP